MTRMPGYSHLLLANYLHTLFRFLPDRVTSAARFADFFLRAIFARMGAHMEMHYASHAFRNVCFHTRLIPCVSVSPTKVSFSSATEYQNNLSINVRILSVSSNIQNNQTIFPHDLGTAYAVYSGACPSN